jgi:hypothetical protein
MNHILNFQFKDEESPGRGQELLHTGYVYEAPLNQGSVVDLKLWFARKSALRVKGYVWVELGDRDGGVRKIEGDELIMELVIGQHFQCMVV